MTRLVLDTNTVIALLNDTTSKPAKPVRLENPTDIAISAVVAHELFYGAFKSRRAMQNVAVVDSLQFEVLEFDKEDARRAGEIRAFLLSKGTPIGPYEVLIAGQAVAREMTLVRHNAAEFQRVPKLRLQDWHTQRHGSIIRAVARPKRRFGGEIAPSPSRTSSILLACQSSNCTRISRLPSF